MFAGLLASMLNEGEVPTGDKASQIMNDLAGYYQRMGHMESSSGDLFESFLKTGMGARPIMVGYENQLVQYAIEHEEHHELLRNRIRVLYPIPTVWSSHPMLSLTDKGKKLTEAFKDPELMKIAWEDHGFPLGHDGGPQRPRRLEAGRHPRND